MDGAEVHGALTADRLNVTGSMHLREQARFAEVRLVGTRVGGDLVLVESVFGGTLEASGIGIGGNLLMRGGTFGNVKLAFADVGGSLELDDTDIEGVVNLSGMLVERELRLVSPGSEAPRWGPGARLIPRNVYTGALNDTEDSWPPGPDRPASCRVDRREEGETAHVGGEIPCFETRNRVDAVARR